jgi:hypothetical protein
MTWLYVPHAIPPDALKLTIPTGWNCVIGVEMESLRTRVVQPLDDKLAALGVKRCAGVMIESPTSLGVKAGWPFHRLSQLRDRGVTSQFWVDVSDVQDAEWLVENTPAHAVVIGYGIADQAAKYRLLKSANDMGVAVVGKGVQGGDDMEDVRLRSGEPGLTTQIIDLPTDLTGLGRVLEVMQMDMTPAELNSAWEAYAKDHPEPPRPKGAHPPEFGA